METASILKFALIVAGGTGTRMGAGLPKQMLPLHGRAVLAHTIDRFLDFDATMQVVVVLHPSLADGWPAFLGEHFAAGAAARIHICLGGAERSVSVHNGLAHVQGLTAGAKALVAIHDAVRPFVNARILAEGFGLAAQKGNAVAAVAVKSSMRMLTPTGSQAVDRELYYHVQTPQIFWLDEILDGYQRRGDETFTDDASLGERHGMNIQLYTGSYDNLKITTPDDLIVAERIWERGGW